MQEQQKKKKKKDKRELIKTETFGAFNERHPQDSEKETPKSGENICKSYIG